MKVSRIMLGIAVLTAMVLLCSFALAEGLTVETEPGLFRVKFSLPGENFAIVNYATSDESGWFTVYSEDGQFAGESALLGSYDPCRLTVKVQRVDQKLVEQVKVNYPGTPLPKGTALEFQSGRKNVRDLVLTPVEGGFAYDFTAQGHGFVKLQIRATRQTGTVILYPDENYHYSGTIMVPHIYNASNVYVTLRSGKGSGSIATGQTTKGYALKAKETGSAPEGRLKGVRDI